MKTTMKTSMLYLTAAVLLCGCGQFMKGLSARAEQGMPMPSTNLASAISTAMAWR